MAIVGAGLFAGSVLGVSDAMADSEIDALRASIARCWSPPPGTEKAGLVVRLRVEVTLEGKLATPPEILNRQPGDVYRRLAESALRALRECQPYRAPREKYASWKTMLLNFDPREFGGDAETADAGPSPPPPGAIEDGALPQGEGWEKVGW